MSEDPLSALAWPRRTDRLLVRRLRTDDAERLWAIRSRPEVHEWITSIPRPVEELREQIAEPEWAGKQLVVELDGEIVGDLYLDVTDAWAQREVREQAANAQAEIGWTLDPAFQGQGLATEAVRELLRICFEELGIRRVIAVCFADNEPSWRLMERLGMRREAVSVAESLHRTRGWLDAYTYALLAPEWDPA